MRENVQNDITLLFLTLRRGSLIVGAIGIENVTLVSVMRTPGEMGCGGRLGRHGASVSLQFLLESATIGILGEI